MLATLCALRLSACRLQRTNHSPCLSAHPQPACPTVCKGRGHQIFRIRIRTCSVRPPVPLRPQVQQLLVSIIVDHSVLTRLRHVGLYRPCVERIIIRPVNLNPPTHPRVQLGPPLARNPGRQAQPGMRNITASQPEGPSSADPPSRLGVNRERRLRRITTSVASSSSC